MKIVLASASPRRKEMLGNIFPDFETLAPNVDESPFSFETPIEHAKRLSYLKATTIFAITQKQYQHQLVIASDTIVVLNNDILGKPKDYSDAFRMLSLLSGNTHAVCTAITMIHALETKCETITQTEVTNVTFKKLSEDDIARYLAMIEWRDKAGSYAAQHGGELIIANIDGSFTNVIGFPLRRFFAMMATLGLERMLFDHPCREDAILQ